MTVQTVNHRGSLDYEFRAGPTGTSAILNFYFKLKAGRGPCKFSDSGFHKSNGPMAHGTSLG